MRHEPIDLLVLKRVLEAAPVDDLVAFIQSTPTGAVTRRIWFFYETLTGMTLDINDAPAATAVEALDSTAYYTAKERLTPRHRVRDNLLDTGAFYPVIRKTPKLEQMIALNLTGTAKDTIGKTGSQVIVRVASLMLLADSRAGLEIEGGRPPINRLERWGARCP